MSQISRGILWFFNSKEFAEMMSGMLDITGLIHRFQLTPTVGGDMRIYVMHADPTLPSGFAKDDYTKPLTPPVL